jgi:hypothetical protein
MDRPLTRADLTLFSEQLSLVFRNIPQEALVQALARGFRHRSYTALTRAIATSKAFYTPVYQPAVDYLARHGFITTVKDWRYFFTHPWPGHSGLKRFLENASHLVSLKVEAGDKLDPQDIADGIVVKITPKFRASSQQESDDQTQKPELCPVSATEPRQMIVIPRTSYSPIWLDSEDSPPKPTLKELAEPLIERGRFEMDSFPQSVSGRKRGVSYINLTQKIGQISKIYEEPMTYEDPITMEPFWEAPEGA